jgi:hypothetical protein
MKEGAWIEAETGNWHWIDDHADWIRRPECARSAGLTEEVVLRLAAMPRRAACGPERNAILIAAMSEGGLINLAFLASKGAFLQRTRRASNPDS